MSSNQYSSHHLTRVGESSQHRDTKLSDTSRDRSAMGSMVSALSTVFCGSSKHADSGTEYIVPASTGSGIPHNYTLVKNRQNLSCEGPPILARRTDRHSSAGYTSEESDSEYCDAAENETSYKHSSPRANGQSDLPHIDEDSDMSLVSASEGILADEKAATGAIEDVIEVSDVEYSADEEQEEVEEEIDSEEDGTDGEESCEDEIVHYCDSECDHSEYENEASSDEEDKSIPESTNSDIENNNYYDSEVEYESDCPPDSDNQQSCMDGEVIEMSEDEASCDDEQLSEQEVELECDFDCSPDCNSDHHECSSQCGCLEKSFDSETEADDAHTSNTQNTDTQAHLPQAYKQASEIPQSTKYDILQDITSQQILDVRPERNHNKLHRNNSQRQYTRSNTADIMGELKTAIDAHVRRSASCREASSEYRKKYLHSETNTAGISENISKLDIKDREQRRKDRRLRLRTLELKREQCLDELREGAGEHIADKLYREVGKIETT